MKRFVFVVITIALLTVACGKKEETQPVTETATTEQEIIEEATANVETEVEKTVSMNFVVYGKGETAKKMIETAAMSVKGVTEASWDIEKMMINLKGTSEVEWETVHNVIAGAGFDTAMKKATKEAYNALPDEAKYTRVRKATVRDDQEGTSQKNKTEAGRVKAKRQKAE